MKPLTVKELIKALKTMPQNATVQMEGCDCWGEAGLVSLENENSVLISRVS